MDIAVEKAQRPPLAPVRPHIGEILVSSGVLKESDVEKILTVQRKRGLHFGEAAVALRIVSERDLRRALAAQFDYPFVAPGESALSPTLAAKPVTNAVVRLSRHRVVHRGASQRRWMQHAGCESRARLRATG